MSPDFLSLTTQTLEGFTQPFLMSSFAIEEFLLAFFIGLGTITVLLQLIPAILLLIYMLRGMIFLRQSNFPENVCFQWRKS